MQGPEEKRGFSGRVPGFAIIFIMANLTASEPLVGEGWPTFGNKGSVVLRQPYFALTILIVNAILTP